MPTSRSPDTGRATTPPADEAEFHLWLNRFAAHRSPRGAEGRAHAQRFLATLGDPQDRVPAVHIVGTAGKGTIAHLLTSRLVERGRTVATHMSPHVDDPRERFMIDGRLPDWRTVLSAASEVDRGAGEILRTTGRWPSYFAVTAAMSWVVGRAAATDFSVVEAGMGGRFDATNVIQRTDRILVVSAIGIDHVDVLGSTVKDITIEKVAAARGCSRVVLAPQPHPGASATVIAEAERMGLELVEVLPTDGHDWRLEADSVAAAVEALLLGGPVTRPGIRPLPPGRLEHVHRNGREFILDGAHNEMKLSGLLRSLVCDTGGPAACVIAAVGRSKDLTSCAAAVSRLAPIVIATEFDTSTGAVGAMPASWTAAELAAAVEIASPRTRTLVADSHTSATTAAVQLTEPDALIAVTGSFLHLSGMRAALEAGRR